MNIIYRTWAEVYNNLIVMSVTRSPPAGLGPTPRSKSSQSLVLIGEDGKQGKLWDTSVRICLQYTFLFCFSSLQWCCLNWEGVRQLLKRINLFQLHCRVISSLKMSSWLSLNLLLLLISLALLIDTVTCTCLRWGAFSISSRNLKKMNPLFYPSQAFGRKPPSNVWNFPHGRERLGHLAKAPPCVCGAGQ